MDDNISFRKNYPRDARLKTSYVIPHYRVVDSTAASISTSASHSFSHSRPNPSPPPKQHKAPPKARTQRSLTYREMAAKLVDLEQRVTVVEGKLAETEMHLREAAMRMEEINSILMDREKKDIQSQAAFNRGLISDLMFPLERLENDQKEEDQLDAEEEMSLPVDLEFSFFGAEAGSLF